MAPVFNVDELGALLFAVLIVNPWPRRTASRPVRGGVQLLSLYAVLGLVFYFA